MKAGRTLRAAFYILALALLIAGCKSGPTTVHIAVMTASVSTRDALQASIDATHQEGMPLIRVGRDYDQVLPRLEVTDALSGTLNEAYSFVRNRDYVAVVGPAGSRDALMVGPVFREANLPFVMPTANSPQVASLAPTGITLAPPLEEEADFIADFVARRLRADDALIFHESDEWGSHLAQKTAAALWFRDIPVLESVPVSTWTCNTGSGPTTPRKRPAGAEAALRRIKPDVVILATRNDATACIAAVVDRMASGTPMVAGDGTDVTVTYLNQLGGSAEHLYTVTFWHHEHVPSTGIFAELLDTPPSLSLGMTYEATMLLVRAIREAGPTREAVLQFLEEKNRAGRILTRGVDPEQPAVQTTRLLMLRAGVPEIR